MPDSRSNRRTRRPTRRRRRDRHEGSPDQMGQRVQTPPGRLLSGLLSAETIVQLLPDRNAVEVEPPEHGVPLTGHGGLTYDPGTTKVAESVDVTRFPGSRWRVGRWRFLGGERAAVRTAGNARRSGRAHASGH